MDPNKLKTVIQPRLDAGDRHADIRAWLAEDVTQAVRASIADIFRVALQSGAEVDIQDLAAGGVAESTPAELAVAKQFARIFDQKIVGDLDVAHPRVQAALDLLVASPRVPSFTATERAQIEALGTRNVARWQDEGLTALPQLRAIALAEAEAI